MPAGLEGHLHRPYAVLRELERRGIHVPIIEAADERDLLEEVVLNAEFIGLRDQFGHQRLREGKYTPGQIDTQWTDDIKKDFLKWLDENPGKLPMTRAELDQFMKGRTW